MEQKMQIMAAEKKNMMPLILHTKPNVLPNDIIIEILLQLSVKSLFRLRWVCKYWFDLITNNSDSFIKMQLHRSTTTIPLGVSFCFVNIDDHFYSNKLYQGSYYFNYNDTNQDVPSEVNRIGHQLEPIDGILGSSNGLVLLMTKHLCILNPCTKEYKVLPRPHFEHAVYYERNLVMKEAYGFGYDQTIDDYKVIRIKYFNVCHDRLLDVQVYTLSKNSWRNIIDANIPYTLDNCSGVFLNGALYWMDSSHQNIISFDIEKEKFHHVSRTPNLVRNDELYRHQVLRSDNPDYLHKLQVFEGSLCFVIKINSCSPAEIWVMKDCTVNNDHNNNALWVKLLTLPHLLYFPIKPLRYTMNGEILMLNNRKDLVLYDTKNTRYQTLGNICKDDRKYFLLLDVYTESLVSVNSGTYTDQPEKDGRCDDSTEENMFY